MRKNTVIVAGTLSVLLAVTACGGGGAGKTADKGSADGMIASLNLPSDAPATVGGWSTSTLTRRTR